MGYPIQNRCIPKKGRINDVYIFPSDFLFSFNVGALKFNVVHAAAIIFSISYTQLQESEKVRPKCL